MGAGKGRGGVSCVCYWGCGNLASKIVWAVLIVFLCLGAGLIIGGAVGVSKCAKDYDACVDGGTSKDTCEDRVEDACNAEKATGLLVSGIVIFFFASPLLTSYFCCCAKRPVAPRQEGTGLVVVSSAAVDPNHPGAPYPPYGGYYPPHPFPVAARSSDMAATVDVPGRAPKQI